MKKVLFICTHNSARSQIAEGLLRYLGGNKYNAFSAGTEKTFVRPQAIEVMKEIGIGISNQTSKTLDQFLNKRFDEVITLCDTASQVCPVFPNAASRKHWSLPDPSKAQGAEDEKLKAYRTVRDELKKKIEEEFINKK